jgi:hypothetical protein
LVAPSTGLLSGPPWLTTRSRRTASPPLNSSVRHRDARTSPNSNRYLHGRLRRGWRAIKGRQLCRKWWPARVARGHVSQLLASSFRPTQGSLQSADHGCRKVVHRSNRAMSEPVHCAARSLHWPGCHR